MVLSGVLRKVFKVETEGEAKSSSNTVYYYYFFSDSTPYLLLRLIALTEDINLLFACFSSLFYLSFF
jgi:hypothetical protein